MSKFRLPQKNVDAMYIGLVYGECRIKKDNLQQLIMKNACKNSFVVGMLQGGAVVFVIVW
jgi:hypothetical protein